MPPFFTSTLTNAAVSEAWGAEFELLWRPTPEFTSTPRSPTSIRSSPSSSRPTRSTPGLFAPGADPNALLQDLSGNATRMSPKWSVNLYPTYEFALGNGGTITLGTNFAYKSKQYHTEFNDERLSRTATSSWDANILYEAPDGQLSVNLWVKNITDELVYAGSFSISTSRAIGGTLMPPRSYGVTVGSTRPQASGRMRVRAGRFGRSLSPEEERPTGRDELDSNQRPPHPQCDALPGCATSRSSGAAPIGAQAAIAGRGKVLPLIATLSALLLGAAATPEGRAVARRCRFRYPRRSCRSDRPERMLDFLAAGAAAAAPPGWISSCRSSAWWRSSGSCSSARRCGSRRSTATRSPAVKKGDQVVTAGGLLGKVIKVDDHYAEIEIAQGVRVKAVKSTIGDIVPPGGKPAND